MYVSNLAISIGKTKVHWLIVLRAYDSMKGINNNYKTGQVTENYIWLYKFINFYTNWQAEYFNQTLNKNL